MPALLEEPPRIAAAPAPPRPPAAPPEPRGDDGGGDWPSTRRVMPWSLAVFTAMLLVVPFDSITLPVSLPFDLRMDRLLLGGIVVLWLMSMLARPALRPRLRSMGGIDAAIIFFLLVCVLSVLVNAEMLAIQDEFTGSLKKIFLLFSYVTFFYIASTILRPSELGAFCLLIVGLTCVAALDVLWEYRQGASKIYELADMLPGFSVQEAPQDPRFGRELVTGPTRHPIAMANIVAFALPFALIGVLQSPKGTGRRLFYGFAMLLLLCASFATIRKTAALAPVGALAVVFLYRPRQMLRLLPYGIAIVLVANFAVAPGSVVRVKSQLVNLDENKSVEARKEDWPALASDVAAKPVLGRGHGSFEIPRHRLLDNEIYQRIVETGYLGLAGYLLIIAAVIAAAHQVVRRKIPERAGPAVAVVACAAVFAMVSAFYDVMSFPQVPYMFFLLAAIAVVASQRPDPPVRTPAVAP